MEHISKHSHFTWAHKKGDMIHRYIQRHDTQVQGDTMHIYRPKDMIHKRIHKETGYTGTYKDMVHTYRETRCTYIDPKT